MMAGCNGCNCPLRQLPCCWNTEVRDDVCGDRSYRILFEEVSDSEVLTTIVHHSIRTPEQQKTLALQMNAVYDRRDISPRECAWMFHLIEDLLEEADRRGCVEAGWQLYEILVKKKRLDDIDDPLWLLYSAAEAGSTGAQLEIGSLFVRLAEDDTDDRQVDYAAQYCGGGITAEEAVYWLEKALPRESEAGFLLMRMFHDGCGVEADEARAIRYCRMVAETHYEGSTVDYPQTICIRHLADCYATGQGVPQDRTMAAQLYQRTDDSKGFLFGYYSDGVDTPRNPRAAVQWWLRDTCYMHGIEYIYWNFRMGIWSGEACPDHLRWLKEPSMEACPASHDRAIKEDIYHCLEREEIWHTREDPLHQHELVSCLLNQERVRLLYDAAQNGDARCESILQSLLANGTATQEMLAKLTPGKYGIYDWPDTWYEEALGLIESKLAWEAQQIEQYKDLDLEDLFP